MTDPLLECVYRLVKMVPDEGARESLRELLHESDHAEFNDMCRDCRDRHGMYSSDSVKEWKP